MGLMHFNSKVVVQLCGHYIKIILIIHVEIELRLVASRRLCSRAVTIHSCHDPIRFDSVRSRSDRFDPIHYPFVQTNTTKISDSECHLNDLLNKITMNKMTMNKIMMSKEHKIHHNTSTSNCNNVILFVMLDKNQFVGIFWQQCR